MRIIPITIILLSFFAKTFPQNSLESFLQKVEEGNRQLKAAQKFSEVQNLEAKTDLWPENPEVEYGYFPASGSPEKKQMYGINQSFDFPSAYLTKSKISDVRQVKNKYEYRSFRQSILTEASLKYYQLSFLQAREEEYRERLEDTQKLFESFQARFDKGDLSVLDLNKAKLQYLSMKNELMLIRQQIETLLEELRLMTGDCELEILEAEYQPLLLLPVDTIINQTLNTDPRVQSLQEEMKISELSVKLSKQNKLPGFSVGFEVEEEPENTFRGVKAGMSIPLWENKNTTRLARAEHTWLESREEEMLNRLVNQKTKLYQKALSLQEVIKEYRDLLETTSNVDYLDKALSLGQISVIDYFTELRMYYSAIDRYMETEREYYQTLVELYDYRW